MGFLCVYLPINPLVKPVFGAAHWLATTAVLRIFRGFGMTFHPGFAVSFAAILVVAAGIVAGYRGGRSRSAWRDWHDARQALRNTRRDALATTVRFVAASVIVLATLFAAGFNAAR
jgi:hypothetical protein